MGFGPAGATVPRKMECLAAQWREQPAEAARLDVAIEENLATAGMAGRLAVGPPLR